MLATSKPFIAHQNNIRIANPTDTWPPLPAMPKDKDKLIPKSKPKDRRPFDPLVNDDEDDESAPVFYGFNYPAPAQLLIWYIFA